MGGSRYALLGRRRDIPTSTGSEMSVIKTDMLVWLVASFRSDESQPSSLY
jgi:hypothetical protein